MVTLLFIPEKVSRSVPSSSVMCERDDVEIDCCASEMVGHLYVMSAGRPLSSLAAGTVA